MTITKIAKAALYLRSSKDRSDVSIDAQRSELRKLAADRGLIIVVEHVDVVLSGKDENRPGFQALITELKDKRRTWSTILMLDTSRLARNQYIAHTFRHHCKKRGIDVVFAKTPEMDGVTGIVLPAVLHAMDEVHSFMSREKGLAGMAENVKQGWRAGGRAPAGYRLEHTETGAVRDGMPVRKSKLVPSDLAPAVKHYLQLRAHGAKRVPAQGDSGFEATASTLVGIEWNALTYAGHTVWNVRYEHGAGGYANSVKRRPRSEWMVQRDTHPALISDDEAEAILVRLESFERGTAPRADYLLTGLLKAPDGTNWRGSDGNDGGFYRMGKGKRVKAATVETAVLGQLVQDLRTDSFVQDITEAARKRFADRQLDTALPALRKDMGELDRRIKRLTEMLADTSMPDPLLRQIEEFELKRNGLVGQIQRREEDERHAAKVKALAAPQVGRTLAMIADDFDKFDRDKLRDLLNGLVEQITLDAAAETFRITYRLACATGIRMASPRGDESNTGFTWKKRQLRAA